MSMAGNRNGGTGLTMSPELITGAYPMRIYLQDYAALLGFTLSLLFIFTVAFA